mgnify:CR=1 FL=1
MNAMKIAVIAPSVLPSPPGEGYGGAEAVVASTCRSLGDLGIDYTLFAPKGSKALGGKLIETIDAPGVWTGREELDAWALYKDQIKRSEFDVLVDFSHEGRTFRRTGWTCPVPVVKMFMGLSTWESAMPPVPGGLVYVTISQYHWQVTKRALGIDSEILNHGIDTELHTPSEPSERRYYLVFSMMARHKGQFELLRKLARYDDVAVMGEGRFVPDAGYVEQLGKFCGLNNIPFHTSLSLNQKIAYFQDAKAVVLPFLPSGEAWSLIATEAMACGTPVLTTDTGAMREIVAPGTGRLFKDVEALAKGMRDEGFTYPACREHAVKNFDRMVNARRLLDICRRLIDAGGGGT